MEKQITCIVCPMGCNITVVGEGSNITSVTGFTCHRGEKYARDEFVCPVRTLTTTVEVESEFEPLLPVRTEKPVPKAKLFECMEIIHSKKFSLPIKEHQILIEDLAGTGVDLIACTDRLV